MADKINWSSQNAGANSRRMNISSESRPEVYEIRVKGQLDSHWSDWLEGMEVRLLENGEMILFGPIIDQAALIGVLNKLSWLNLSLVSVNEINQIQEEKK